MYIHTQYFDDKQLLSTWKLTSFDKSLTILIWKNKYTVWSKNREGEFMPFYRILIKWILKDCLLIVGFLLGMYSSWISRKKESWLSPGIGCRKLVFNLC